MTRHQVHAPRLPDYSLPTLLSVGIRNVNGCLEWPRARFWWGYGALTVDGKTRRLHRFVWELANGPVPKGLLVLHRCDNPPCYEPSHLWLGTHAENMADCVAKGRKKWSRAKRRTPQTQERIAA